ncbi:hypothetical protein D1BOALGB6SA_491 [Olavius sp. associated proteobacterium Delta 1]|nr:hypothetical protein D1BOALGB6SA_491 [Olavius sp. associated proteobacterium Delta 1]
MDKDRKRKKIETLEKLFSLGHLRAHKIITFVTVTRRNL